MGKRSRKDVEAREIGGNSVAHAGRLILIDEKGVDPSLALLFASSSGPVQPPPKSLYEDTTSRKRRRNESQNGDASPRDEHPDSESEVKEDEELSNIDEDLEDVDVADVSNSEETGEEPDLERILEVSSKKLEKKRKRRAAEEDLEGKYLQKLVKEEEKEEEERQAERRLKRRKVIEGRESKKSVETNDIEVLGDDDSAYGTSGDVDKGFITPKVRAAASDVPLHESLAPGKEVIELEKASRTVFLANVSTEAITSKSAKKALLAHMASFLVSLPAPPEGKSPHKLESLRFRSTAYAGNALPKKAAFAKKELMAATTKSTNAYVVYSTAYAAREAIKRLNGSMVLDRHLRVDGVAHPTKTDHRRCVFVGNLGFVDDESMLVEGGENERKRSKIPSDIEEGLWRQFGKAGAVESVRVVRDEKTRVGKGFAYVQFQDANSVEAALLFNDKKYPPMLPRPLRVVRAKAVRKTALASQTSKAGKQESHEPKNNTYNPKVSAEASSLQGRARKLLGRAGAAYLKRGEGSGANRVAVVKNGSAKVHALASASGFQGIKRTPESFVFEGYRASAKAGRPKDLKLGGKGGGKKKGKPKTKGSKRASEWRKSGGKKTAA